MGIARIDRADRNGGIRLVHRLLTAACAVSLLIGGTTAPSRASVPSIEVAFRDAPRLELRARKPGADWRGPSIEVRSLVHDPRWSVDAPVEMVFQPGPDGHEVDMSSLEVTYKKAWGFDITERVAAYIEGDVIRVPSAELPAGRHALEIYIEDEQQNPTRVVLHVTIPKAAKR